MTLKGHAERRVLFCTFSESTKAVLRFGFVRDGSFSARRSLGRLSLHAVRLRRKDRQREEKTEVFCQTFVHKSLWVSKGQSPWSHSAECDTPYRQAHFWKCENFLQEKKFSQTAGLYRLISKIIRWMIFDGTSLNLVLAEPGPYTSSARGRVV